MFQSPQSFCFFGIDRRLWAIIVFAKKPLRREPAVASAVETRKKNLVRMEAKNLWEIVLIFS
jgi:hypothetical protein